MVERDSLRNQNRILAFESFNYKQQFNDLEDKNRCHLQHQQQIKEQMNKINGTFIQVNQTFDLLTNKTQMSLQKFDKFVATNENLLLAAKQANLMRNLAKQEKERIEDQLIYKTGNYNLYYFSFIYECNSIAENYTICV